MLNKTQQSKNEMKRFLCDMGYDAYTLRRQAAMELLAIKWHNCNIRRRQKLNSHLKMLALLTGKTIAMLKKQAEKDLIRLENSL